MNAALRRHRPADTGPVVALSLRAWAPVFASLEDVLGPSGVFGRLHPDWRASQRAAVESVCSEAGAVWVAEEDGQVVGFCAANLHPGEGIGEVVMIAVDPPSQRRGIGAALTAAALDWIQAEGMTVAMVETGGDSGHAPARAAYGRAGFTKLPVARYFKLL